MYISSNAVTLTIDGGQVQTIPKGELARNFRYRHENRKRWVSNLTAVKELNSTEAGPRLYELEAQFSRLLDGKDGPKRRDGKRPLKLYRMMLGVMLVAEGDRDAN